MSCKKGTNATVVIYKSLKFYSIDHRSLHPVENASRVRLKSVKRPQPSLMSRISIQGKETRNLDFRLEWSHHRAVRCKGTGSNDRLKNAPECFHAGPFTNSKRFVKLWAVKLCCGCGAVGRAVASDIRDLRFESQHRHNLEILSVLICQLLSRKDKNKEK